MLQIPPFVTKLIVPQRKSAILSRPRLLQFLHEYLDRKLILVSAAAGYGKTTLLVDFSHDTELPVCWYSLDESDRDPQIFLEYLLRSLQYQFPRFGARTASLLRNMPSASLFDQVVGTLVTEIYDQIASYFVLVLDDYHLVDSSGPVNRILDNLLNYLPDNAHIILATRTLPTQLTLTRLTARIQVAGLGFNDLRFTADEIRELIKQNYSLDITESAAQQLADQSEGWIASIVLTSPTLWQGLFKDWAVRQGPGSQFFDYLATEVFAQQPAPLQAFLEQTSILDQMNAGLCNELLGISNAQAQLDTIETRNLFISHLEEDWYRYHHLFREFLKTHLVRTHPKLYRGLIARAAELFERRGLLGQAIEYWLECEHFEQAARVIEVCLTEMYSQGRWATVARWIDALPESVTQASPELLLWRGKIHVEEGELTPALANLERARTEFERQNDQPNRARVLIEEAVVARFQGQHNECIQKCQAALDQLEPNEFGLTAQAHRTIGGALTAQGDGNGAIAEFERALALYQLINDRYSIGLVEQDLGAAYGLSGDRETATRHFEHALGYWRSLGNAPRIANTLNSIGVTQYYAGALVQARATLEEALQESRREGALRIEGYILAGLADVCRATGDFESALKAGTEAFTIAEKIREAFLATFVLAGMADTWRLSGDLQLAGQLALNAVEAARAHRSDYELALASTALGAVWLEQGKHAEALTWLQQALALFEQHAAQRESARVHYFVSLALFRLQRLDQAKDHLVSLASIGKNLKEDQWLVTEGARGVALIQFAIRQQIELKYFRPILRKLKQLAHAPQPLVEVSQSTWPRLTIRTFGSAEVICESKLIQRTEWQTEATKELFMFFAVQPRAGRKEQIMATLWPEKSAAHANDMFHSSIYRIRRALYPELLLYREGKYQLNPEAEYQLDVNEFERLLDQAGPLDDEATISALRRALELYRGDFLQELYSDWANTRREMLREKYMTALLRLAAFERHVGHFDEAIKLYQTALEKDNLREEVYRALMILYQQLGERTQAIQTYKRCLQILKEELGVSPMPETISLYKQIVRSA